MQQHQVQSKDREKIELFFSARGLTNLDTFSNSDSQLFVYLKEGRDGQEKLIGKTEVRKNNLNPDWKTSIVLNFIFEMNQYLRIVAIDNDGDKWDDNDIIGTLDTTVGQVMGSINQIFIGPLKHKNQERGKKIIKGDQRKDIGEANPIIYWQWYGKKIKNMDGWFGTSDPFLRFLKHHHNQYWLLDNENPIWRGFEIPHDKLHDNNPLQPFKIELWDNEKNGKHQFIGAIQVTIDQIFAKEQMQFEVKTDKGEFAGQIGIKSLIKPTFIDYLKGGEQINLSIAIEYTGSNGNPKFSDSLHYNHPPALNQYQNALLQVSEILLNYDYDKKVPLYGFGGVPKLSNYNKSSTDHFFLQMEKKVIQKLMAQMEQ